MCLLHWRPEYNQNTIQMHRFFGFFFTGLNQHPSLYRCIVKVEWSVQPIKCMPFFWYIWNNGSFEDQDWHCCWYMYHKCLRGQAVILVIMYVETFKTDNIVFIGLRYNVFEVTLIDTIFIFIASSLNTWKYHLEKEDANVRQRQ